MPRTCSPWPAGPRALAAFLTSGDPVAGGDLQVSTVEWQQMLLYSSRPMDCNYKHLKHCTSFSGLELLTSETSFRKAVGSNPAKVLRFLNIQTEASRIPEALLKSTLCPILVLESQGSRLGNQEKLHQSLDNFCAHRSSGTRDLQQEIVMVTHTLLSLGWE